MYELIRNGENTYDDLGDVAPVPFATAVHLVTCLDIPFLCSLYVVSYLQA